MPDANTPLRAQVPDGADVSSRHQRAVQVLRTMPEGKAMARAEASLRGERGMYDPLRSMPEEPAVARLLPLRSVADRAVRVPAKKPLPERWEAKVRAAGVDPLWRPQGGERGLFLPGAEDSLDDVRAWIEV